MSLLRSYLFLWQEVLAYESRKGDSRKIDEQRKYKHKIKRIIKAYDETKRDQKHKELKTVQSKIPNSTQKICFLFYLLQEKTWHLHGHHRTEVVVNAYVSMHSNTIINKLNNFFFSLIFSGQPGMKR